MSWRVLGGKRRPVSVRAGGFVYVLYLVVLVVAVVVLFPIVRMVVFAFGDYGIRASLQELRELPDLVGTLRNTAVVLAVSGSLAALFGAVFAWLNERTDARMGWLGRLLPVLPLITPPVAGAIGWGFLLSERPGLINIGVRNLLSVVGIEIEKGPFNIYSWPGLILVYTLFLLPFSYLMVSAGLRNMDSSLEQAALVAGAGPGIVLRRVTIPAVAPSIAAGAVLTVLSAVALFSVPVIIGTTAKIDVLTVQIYRLLTFTFPPKTGAALLLSAILLVTIFVVLVIQRHFTMRARHAVVGGKSGRPYIVPLGRWKFIARAAMTGYILLAAVLPLGALLVVSLQPFWSAHLDVGTFTLQNYREVLFEYDFVERAIRNSVLLGVFSAIAGLAVALCFVMVVQRRPAGFGVFADGISKLPGSLSHVVIGVAMVISFTGPPFRLAGSLFLLFVTYVVLYLPQSTTTATAAYAQVAGELTEAAMVCGAGHARTLRLIQLPVMRPHLIAGAGVLFVLGAGEITASALLSGTRNPVAGALLLEYWQNGTFPELAAVTIVVATVSAAVVLGILRLAGRTVDAQP